MTYEILNINEIIITKTFELFQSPDDNNIFMQLKMLHEIKKEYSKLLEDVFYNNKKPIDNTIIDLFTEIIENQIEHIEVECMGSNPVGPVIQRIQRVNVRKERFKHLVANAF